MKRIIIIIISILLFVGLALSLVQKVAKTNIDNFSLDTIKKIDKRDAPATFASGLVNAGIYGAIGTIFVPIGVVIVVIFLAQAIFSLPEIIQAVKEMPHSSIWGIIGTALGICIGVFGAVYLKKFIKSEAERWKKIKKNKP